MHGTKTTEPSLATELELCAALRRHPRPARRRLIEHAQHGKLVAALAPDRHGYLRHALAATERAAAVRIPVPPTKFTSPPAHVRHALTDRHRPATLPRLIAIGRQHIAPPAMRMASTTMWITAGFAVDNPGPQWGVARPFLPVVWIGRAAGGGHDAAGSDVCGSGSPAVPSGTTTYGPGHVCIRAFPMIHAPRSITIP